MKLKWWEFGLLVLAVASATVLIANRADAELLNLLWWLYRG